MAICQHADQKTSIDLRDTASQMSKTISITRPNLAHIGHTQKKKTKKTKNKTKQKHEHERCLFTTPAAPAAKAMGAVTALSPEAHMTGMETARAMEKAAARVGVACQTTHQTSPHHPHDRIAIRSAFIKREAHATSLRRKKNVAFFLVESGETMGWNRKQNDVCGKHCECYPFSLQSLQGHQRSSYPHHHT